MLTLRLTLSALLNSTLEPVLSTDTNSSSHAPPPKNCSISSPTGPYWSGTRSLHLWPSQTRWPPSNWAWPDWSTPATSVSAESHSYDTSPGGSVWITLYPDLDPLTQSIIDHCAALQVWSPDSVHLPVPTPNSASMCAPWPPAHSGGHGSSGTRPKHEVPRLPRLS